MGCGTSQFKAENEILQSRLGEQQAALQAAQQQAAERDQQVASLRSELQGREQALASCRADHRRQLQEYEAQAAGIAQQRDKMGAGLERQKQEYKAALAQNDVLQEELNDRRESMAEQQRQIRQLDEELGVAQTELSKWYRHALSRDKALEEREAEVKGLQGQLNQVASKKLMLLAESGRVFEMGSTKLTATADR